MKNWIEAALSDLYARAYSGRDGPTPAFGDPAQLSLLGWNLTLTYAKPGTSGERLSRWGWILRASNAGGSKSYLKQFVEFFGVHFTAELPPGRSKDGRRTWLWTHEGDVTALPADRSKIQTIKIQKAS